MVNGGLREHAAELSKTVSGLTAGKPVRYLFNTDWHAEHTGSNELLGRSGAQIIAHENTKQYLGTDIFVEWQHRTYKALPKVALADSNVLHGRKDDARARADRVRSARAGAHRRRHLRLLPRRHVLVAGDVLAVGTYPIADYISGGWLGGLMTATKTLLDLTNDETRVVPGVGPCANARGPQGAARHARHASRAPASDDAEGHGRRGHARSRRDERVRRALRRSRALHDHRPIADCGSTCANWVGSCEDRFLLVCRGFHRCASRRRGLMSPRCRLHKRRPRSRPAPLAPRALLDTVLRDVSQPANENRRPDVRHDGPGEAPRTRRRVGEDGAQAARRHDAASRCAHVRTRRASIRWSSWLERSLDEAAAAHPNPGRVALHRLNRAEYAAAIEDLLGLKIDAAALLPEGR